jgi:hypothetical protein
MTQTRDSKHEDVSDRNDPRRRHRQGSGARGAPGAGSAGGKQRQVQVRIRGLRLGRRLLPQARRDDAADGLDALRDKDAILFGSAGDPDIPDHITLWACA